MYTIPGRCLCDKGGQHDKRLRWNKNPSIPKCIGTFSSSLNIAKVNHCRDFKQVDLFLIKQLIIDFMAEEWSGTDLIPDICVVLQRTLVKLENCYTPTCTPFSNNLFSPHKNISIDLQAL